MMVLTCWHVIVDPANGTARNAIFADFPDRPSAPRVKVAIGREVPVTDDGAGDLAVLALPEPAPVAAARLAVRIDEPTVRVFGYPEGVPTGVWVTATVTGAIDERSGWRQLDRASGSAAVERGFSGAGVHDENGAVIGIVVARATLSGHIVAWMIPMDRWPIRRPGVSAAPPTRQLGFTDRHALAVALGEVWILKTAEGRQLVVQNLPPPISRVIPSFNSAGLDLFGLVNAVLAFDDGFAHLYSVVEVLAGPDTIAVANLRRLAIRLGLPVDAP
jgi:S1-C subfamily serine protease